MKRSPKLSKIERKFARALLSQRPFSEEGSGKKIYPVPFAGMLLGLLFGAFLIIFFWNDLSEIAFASQNHFGRLGALPPVVWIPLVMAILGVAISWIGVLILRRVRKNKLAT